MSLLKARLSELLLTIRPSPSMHQNSKFSDKFSPRRHQKSFIFAAIATVHSKYRVYCSRRHFSLFLFSILFYYIYNLKFNLL